jgi:hypothetical protein
LSNVHESDTPKGHFIAYLDILGYERKLEDGDELYKTIQGFIGTFTQLTEGAYKPHVENYSDIIKMKAFSDNFIICSEWEYAPMLEIIGNLQFALVAKNIFFRGAMCYGDLIFNKDFVYGRGIIDAYKMESEIAIFPRIVIDNSFVTAAAKLGLPGELKKATFKDMRKYMNPLTCVDDFDNHRFLDYLGVAHGIVEKKKPKDTEAIDSYFFEVLSAHKTYIVENLSVKDRRVKQKYQWCKYYHNNFCKKHGYSDYLIG